MSHVNKKTSEKIDKETDTLEVCQREIWHKTLEMLVTAFEKNGVHLC